jgi:DNA-binding CsgD family transcriptional regulator
VTKNQSPADGEDPTAPEILTPEAVADRLGLSVETVLAALADRKLPGRKFDDQWRVSWPAVLDSFENDPASDVIRPNLLAERLGLTIQTVRVLLDKGHLPGKKFGGSWFVYWPAVLAALSYAEPDDESGANTE